MALKIVLAVILVILALLLMRVHVYVSYEDDFKFRIRYLFITFRMNAAKKGKTKAEKKREKKAEDKPKLTANQLKTFLRLFQKFKDDAVKMLLKLKRRARIDFIKIDVVSGGDDAALTAITYGEACAVIYPALSFLQSNIKIKKSSVSVRAEFNGQSSAEFFCHGSIRLCSLVGVALSGMFKILSVFIKIQRARAAAKVAAAGEANRQTKV